MSGGQLEKYEPPLEPADGLPSLESPVADVGITRPAPVDEIGSLSVGARAGWVLALGALVAVGFYVMYRAPAERAEAIANLPKYGGESYTDDFERENVTSDVFLGPKQDGADLNWSTLGAGWVATAEEGVARVVSGESGRNSLAITDAGQSDFTVVATVINAAPGSGLVFRYQDPNNHWSLTAVPDLAAWNLVRYQNGEVLFEQSLPLTASTPGTTVAVSALGPKISVFIGGFPVISLIDQAFRDQQFIGLVGVDGSAAAYDDFTLLTDPRALVPGGAANG